MDIMSKVRLTRPPALDLFAPERAPDPHQVVALLALVGSAAAFVPAAQPRAAAPAKAVFDEYVGGEGGMPGMAYQFDPAGLAESNPEMVPWFREAELKHGRMCMLASIGMVVPAFVRVPGEQFQGSYTGWEAHDRPVASGAMGQILLFVGLFETLAGIPACVATMNGDREPGDFEFGGIFKPTDPVQLRRKQNAELKNGRLAMIAVLGELMAQQVSGYGTYEQLSIIIKDLPEFLANPTGILPF